MLAWLRRRRLDRQLRSLQQQRLDLLAAARDLQRGGDIRAFASKTAEAEAVLEQIGALEHRIRGSARTGSIAT